MAASLTYRSSATTNPNSWQDASSVPRRQPSLEERDSFRLDHDNLARKRPRSDESMAREEVGAPHKSSSYGDHYTAQPKHSTKSTQQRIHSTNNKGSNSERRTSLGSSSSNINSDRRSSMGSSSNSKSDRRSSVSSTGSHGDSTVGGVRRLKKLKKLGSKKNASSPTKKTKEEEQVESFQQAQLRLWKEAQQRHQKLKEEEEKKRLKKLEKKKLREQLQHERQQKLDAKGNKQSRRDSSDSLLGDQGRKDKAAASKKKPADVEGDGTKPTKSIDWERNNSSKGQERERVSHDPDRQARSAEEREALRQKKKLKRLKKLGKDRAHSDEWREEAEQKTKERRSSMESSIATDEKEGDKATKKKKPKGGPLREGDKSTDVMSNGDRDARRVKKKLLKQERESIKWSQNSKETLKTLKSLSAGRPIDDTDDASSGKQVVSVEKPKVMAEERATVRDSTEEDVLRAKKLKKKLKKQARNGVGTEADSSGDAEALRAKKLKKLARKEPIQHSDAMPFHKGPNDSTEREEFTKPKKKRELKLESMQDDNADHNHDILPRKKKKVKAVDLSHHDQTNIMLAKADTRNTPPQRSAAAPSTPDCKPKIISSLDAPLTPLSLGLADTVKTRIRSPAKVRDQLELLQTASFEKKKKRKRKKNRDIDSGVMEDEHSTLKKKTMKKQLHSATSNPLEAPTRKKLHRAKDDECVYDADVETPRKAGTKGDDTVEADESAERRLDMAERSLSKAGKIKKKKKRPTNFDVTAVHPSGDDVEPQLDQAEVRKSEQPLPLKKRMALAAAAAESSSWEKNTNASTAASKVSLSSAGTGTGIAHDFGCEASSISEFTHPLGSMALPPPPPRPGSFHKPFSVPREIVSKPAVLPQNAPSYGFGANAAVLGPTISSSDESDSDSSDSDTDQEEIFAWANKMFGTSAKPLNEGEEEVKKEEAELQLPTTATSAKHAQIEQEEGEFVFPTAEPANVEEEDDDDEEAEFEFSIAESSTKPVNGDEEEDDDDEEAEFEFPMGGTSVKPAKEEEVEFEFPTTTAAKLVQETCEAQQLCEMERRRQKQEEARTLSIQEVNAILQKDNDWAPAASHWVRRSRRQPSLGLLKTPLVRSLLDKLRGNDKAMLVLKMKKFLSDPDTPSMAIDAALEALEDNTNCQALYIQNFNVGMKDKQVLHLLRILQQPTCNIWCLNIGETYNVTEDTWEEFAEGLKRTKITHMYASEHTITAELKDEIRDTIRWNRRKHNMHYDPKNLDVIIQCTHCWWNPINAKVLRPYLRKKGYESLLHDKEAQGLRGSMSAAPAT